MGWISRFFGMRDRPHISASNHEYPLFPVWLKQQGDISVQEGLDRYIDHYVSVAVPIGPLGSQPRTLNEIRFAVARQSTEITLLEQCREYYGASAMSPEFDELFSTKKLVLQMDKDLLEMKLSGQRAISEAMNRISSKQDANSAESDKE